MISSESWSERGGPGDMSPLVLPRVAVLVISQPDSIHTEIERRFAGRIQLVREPEPPLLQPPADGQATPQDALNHETKFDFIETPLTQVVAFLNAQHKVRIRLDERQMEACGVGTDVPITRSLRPIRLAHGLGLILRDLTLCYYIDRDTIVITTPEALLSRMTTKSYAVGDLTARDASYFVDVIQTLVVPQSWQPVGGPGTVRCNTTRSTLEVKNTRDVQDLVEGLLAGLRAANK